MLLACAAFALLASPRLLADGFTVASMPQLGLADTEAVAYAPFAATNGCSEKIPALSMKADGKGNSPILMCGSGGRPIYDRGVLLLVSTQGSSLPASAMFWSRASALRLHPASSAPALAQVLPRALPNASRLNHDQASARA